MDASCKMCGAPAERQFTEIVGGRKRSMALCLECASKQDLTGPPPRPAQQPSLKVKLHTHLPGPGLPAATLRCPDCGIRLVELRKHGRVGCARCYEIFRKQILPLLRRVHGATEHAGTRPRPEGGEPDLSRLREELRRAIEAEDFEQAARLRDRIGAQRPRASGGDPGEDHE
jgi:protein arginine kinase activator